MRGSLVFIMAESNSEIIYSLDKLGTGAGVGWFSCTPEERPDLDACLNHLADRPFDRFMHQYALELIKDLDHYSINFIAIR